MSAHWIPPGLFEQSPWWINLFENPTAVQFVHRWLAKLLVLGVLVMAWRARRAEAVLAAAIALVQLSLGIATILTGVDIAVATLHQAGAVILLTFVIVVRHRATSSLASPVSAIVGG
jgi:heme a synthase